MIRYLKCYHKKKEKKPHHNKRPSSKQQPINKALPSKMVLAMMVSGNPLFILLFYLFLSQLFLLEYSSCCTINFMDSLLLVHDIAPYSHWISFLYTQVFILWGSAVSYPRKVLDPVNKTKLYLRSLGTLLC